MCNKFLSCYGIIPHLVRILEGRNANDRHVLHRQSAFSLRAHCHVASLSHQHPGSGAAQSNGKPHLVQSFCTLHPTTSRTMPRQPIPSRLLFQWNTSLWHRGSPINETPEREEPCNRTSSQGPSSRASPRTHRLAPQHSSTGPRIRFPLTPAVVKG